MKTKIIPASVLTDSDIEGLLSEIADLRFTQNEIESDLEKLRNALDAALLPIKETYRPEMERKAVVIEDLNTSIDDRTRIVEAWARVNMERQSGSKRSIKLLHGTVGFRLSKPRVAERSGRSFRRAAYWLARLVWGRKYLRPATVNKEAILKDRVELEARPERLRKIGLVIEQDDVFYVETEQVRSDAIQPVHHREAA